MTGSFPRLARVATLLLFATAAQAAPMGLHSAPATPGAVRFTVTVPEPHLQTLDQSDNTSRLDLEGYTLQGEPGAPALPWRVVIVAVPPLGEVRLSAAASELATVEGVLLEPQSSRDETGAPRSFRRPAAYGAPGSSTPVAARLLGVTWMRNQRIARVAIEPAAYAPAARRLTLARRVDVELRVQPVTDLGPPAEPDDPFEPVYRQVLVNFEQGRTWRRPATASLIATARRMGIQPEAALAATVETTSVYVRHAWVKIPVTQAGFYAVNFSALRQLNLFTSLPADSPATVGSLRLFTLPGFPLLPEASYCDGCDLKEVSIGVVDVSDPASPAGGGPDGLFSYNGDSFYFFAQGPSGWATDYDPSLADTVYLDNPYETKSYYYLTVSTAGNPIPGPPARLGTPERKDVAAGSGAVPVTTFDDRAHLEQDIEYWPDASPSTSTLFWEKWFWTSMKPGDTFTHNFDLPGADATQAARFRLRDWGLTDNVLFNGCGFETPDHLIDVRINNLTIPRIGWNSFVAFRGGQITIDTTSVFVRETGNQFTASVPIVSAPTCPGRSDRSALAWFEIYYKRRLQPVDDQLDFRSPAAAGVYHYDVGPFVRATLPRMFDITDPLAPREIKVDASMWTAVAGGFQLSFEDTQSVQRRYRVLPDSLISVARVATNGLLDAPTTSFDNLRSPANGADYVVIYYDGFRPAAEALAEMRKTRLPVVGTSFQTKAIPISALYDQFSGGRTDPAAIRNFLRAAFYNWSRRPRFVTFLGDASYDFKDIKGRAAAGQPGTLLPTYENGFDDNYIVLRQFATDDWLLNVDDPNSFVPEFYGGRLPAGDAQTALDVVTKKIKVYENTAPLGEYRNKLMLIADDDKQGDHCDNLVWTHVQQTDSLNAHTPAHMDRVYVYLHTYPTGPGFTKPGARADIRQNINDGVAIFNYVGHGSPFKISDESVMIDSDAGTFTNGARMPLFCAASCDVGKFNDPTVQSLGERLVMTPSNGAIGVVAATEQAFSSENAQLNRFLFDRIFDRGDVIVGADTLFGQGRYHVPVAAALLAAKIGARGTSEINNAKYQLMGDAALELNLPSLWAEVALKDANNAPVNQLQRGQTVTFTGQVTDSPGASAIPYEGVASIFVEDSAPTLNTGPGCFANSYSVDFVYKAGAIYHGDVSVAPSGTFDGRFVVPMDAAIGPKARVRVYLQGQAEQKAIDGAGALVLPVVTGTANPGDTQGPRVTLSFVGGAISVRPDATLRIDLFDESGIMTTGHSLQNSIVVTIDDNTTSRVDVTPSFRYAADSYQSGTANFTLPGLAAGHHRIKVSAADNLATGLSAVQHRSSATIEFDVVDKPSLHITQSYLFPNPVHSTGAGAGGTFVVDAPGDSLNTLIRLYTISGRLVKTLNRFGSLGQVQIPWDGRDADGDPLANGTYLYRVFVYNREADGSSSAREKAAGEGRIVILNR